MRTFCDQMCTDISTDKSHYNVICVRECVASIDPDDFCKSMCANESAASLVFGWSVISSLMLMITISAGLLCHWVPDGHAQMYGTCWTSKAKVHIHDGRKIQAAMNSRSRRE